MCQLQDISVAVHMDFSSFFQNSLESYGRQHNFPLKYVLFLLGAPPIWILWDHTDTYIRE